MVFVLTLANIGILRLWWNMPKLKFPATLRGKKYTPVYTLPDPAPSTWNLEYLATITYFVFRGLRR